jgi:hypothetical protein
MLPCIVQLFIVPNPAPVFSGRCEEEIMTRTALSINTMSIAPFCRHDHVLVADKAGSKPMRDDEITGGLDGDDSFIVGFFGSPPAIACTGQHLSHSPVLEPNPELGSQPAACQHGCLSRLHPHW